MDRDKKINYLRIALQLQNISINNEMSDRVIETYEQVLKKGGNFSLDDAVDIDIMMKEKYTKKKLEE